MIIMFDKKTTSTSKLGDFFTDNILDQIKMGPACRTLVLNFILTLIKNIVLRHSNPHTIQFSTHCMLGGGSQRHLVTKISIIYSP